MPLIETPIGWIDPLHVTRAQAYQYADALPGDYGHVSLTLAGDPEPRRFQTPTLPDAQRLVAEIVAARNGPDPAGALDERQPEPGTQTIDLRHEPAILHVGELVAALRTFDPEKEIRLLIDDADKGPTEIDLIGIAWGHGDVTVDATFVRSEP